ncbi:MAG: T9SS type A sorting domain-containing protein [Bacteroidota bacterium]
MKRLLLWIIALGSYTQLYAQDVETGEYEASFLVRARDDANNHDGDCTNKFEMYTTLTGEAEKPFWDQDLNPIGEWPWKDYSKTLPIPINQKLTKIKFRGERQWKNFFGCTGNSGESEILITYNGCFQQDYFDRVPQWKSYITVDIYPKAINLYYFNRSNQKETGPENFYLPQAHPIQIKATQGFPSSVYQWQYQIGGDTWLNFPAALSGSSVLSFSGKDIPNINFINDVILPKKSMRVRINYGCDKYSIPLTLIPLLSAPNILAVEATPPSCSYFNDGKLTVTLDRSLYPGETIGFSLNTLLVGPENIDQLSPGNQFTLEGFESFSNQTLSFNGRFNSNYTFTEDPTSHNKQVSVPVRQPVTFTAVESAVHCYNGADGKIDVTAKGGTGSYTASLYQADILVTTIALTETAGNSFVNLKTGTYTVKIKDTNGCSPQDGSGQVIAYVRTVVQPAQKVLVSIIESVEPQGYGLTNGYITVRSQEGTMPYTFYWMNAHGQTLAAEPTQTEGTSQKSTLSGLGKGTYRVRVEDTNYSLPSPQTEVNRCGCYDTLTIVLQEPPLLQVDLAQHRYVSCYGESNGELVAHAMGGRPYLPGQVYHPYQYEWFTVKDNALVAFGASDSLVTDQPSALYRVKVTDRNDIIAWSEDFKLVQPDALKINFQTSQLLCNGDRNGTTAAFPTGGTPPYRYTWTTDETTSSLANLSDGWYSVVVTDVRGCTSYGQTEVTVPDGLAIHDSISQPTCNGDKNGSIALTVTGGKSPYRYQWQHGESTAMVQGLAEDTYSVQVTDANNCFITQEYTLIQPGLLSVDLGPDRVLCKDQVLELNGTIADVAAKYVWLKQGEPFAETASAKLVEAGTYTLEVTDSKGCVNADEIKITRDDAEIAADFVVATRVPRGEKVRLANISHPAPDRVEWILPPGVSVKDQQPSYLELLFDKNGVYEVGLRSFKGACEQTVRKPVRVVDKSELTDYQTPEEPFIKQFMVSPNPNSGKFTATVELREPADFTLILYSGQGNIIIERVINNQSFSQVDFEVSVSFGGGLYMLQLITPKGLSTFKVVTK